jgi:signal transduction histidine kinase/HAMP domain-containing protein
MTLSASGGQFCNFSDSCRKDSVMELQPFRMRRFTLVLMGIILLLLIPTMIHYFAEVQRGALIGINITLALLGLTAGLVQIRWMNSRLAQLAAVAAAIEQGEYNARSTVKGQDAIALLARAVNSMAGKIQSTIEQLECNQNDLEQSRLALAEQHARLEEEFRRQGALGDYLLALNSVDINILAEIALNYTMEAADIQLGLVYLWDEKSAQLLYLAGKGIDEVALSAMEAQFSGAGLPEQVLKKGKWLTIQDIDEEALPKIELGFTRANLRSVVGIPIHFQQKPLGVIVLAALHKLDEPTRKLLEGMVGALGNALQNAVTFKTVEMQALRLEEANKKLLTVDQLRCEFVATMSHELRTPLNAIIGFSGLLMKNRSGALREVELGYAEKVNRNGRLLLDLINDILDLSKIDAGRMDVVVGPVIAVDLMREVLDSLEPQAQAKSLRLRFEVPNGIPPLQTDSEKLRRVLINLVGNAVKFTPRGEVCVRMNPISGEKIQIEVQDSGIGIAEDKFETIFQPFRQVDGGSSREYGGTGLGLAITRSLIKMLGGQICVRSDPGHGSVFMVTLPLSLGAESGFDARLADG